MSETERTLELPAISVIVPVYNGEQFLLEALHSILAQEYQPLEVLVIDDGSTDRSAALAESLPGICVLRKEHSGLAATLNHGVAHATGTLLAFLDADDRWLPGKLARQVVELQRRPELDLVFTYSRQFTTSGKGDSISTEYAPPQPGVAKSNMLVRRASFVAVGAFAVDAHRHDFLDWYGRAMQLGLRAAVVPEVLIERRVHDHNVGRLDPATKHMRFLQTLRAAVHQRRQPEGAGDQM